MAEVIRKDKTLVCSMLNGPRFVTFEAAERLAQHFGRSPEWILGADLTRQFESVDALNRALADESKPWRALMVSLYGRRFSFGSCTNKLAPPARRIGNQP